MAATTTKNGWGGKRPNQTGRPSVRRELDLKNLMDEAWPVADRILSIKAVAALAQAGDVQAAKLLMSYAHGLPIARVEQSGPGGNPIELLYAKLNAADNDTEPTDPPTP